jgi:hypothetical protein
MAGVDPKKFASSQSAIGIANELKGYVDSGHLPTFLEFENKKHVTAETAYEYSPPYDKKQVTYDAVIPKSQVENVARARGFSLPWAIPPKKSVAKMLSEAPKTNPSATGGLLRAIEAYTKR